MKIEVVETRGAACKTLFINVLEAIKACGIRDKVVLASDMQTILKYGIRATPALVINGMVLFAGQTLPSEEIVKLLQQLP